MQHAVIVKDMLIGVDMPEMNQPIFPPKSPVNQPAFKVFNGYVNREGAEHLLATDLYNGLSHDEDAFYELFRWGGLAPLDKWSDEEVLEGLEQLIYENFTQEQIQDSGYRTFTENNQPQHNKAREEELWQKMQTATASLVEVLGEIAEYQSNLKTQ